MYIVLYIVISDSFIYTFNHIPYHSVHITEAKTFSTQNRVPVGRACGVFMHEISYLSKKE